MDRWDFLFAAGSVASMFVPILVALFSADLTGKQRRAARDTRIAEYRRSPDSRLLILND
jgi:hypothetical protein